MSPEHLKDFRRTSGLTQAQMADQLDMSHRAYQDLEKPGARIRGVYALAILGLSLRLAVERGDTRIMTPEAVSLVTDLRPLLSAEDLARADYAGVVVFTPEEAEYAQAMETALLTPLTHAQKARLVAAYREMRQWHDDQDA
jgi:transcriptional regulator with XRE-family HTH domain